MWGFGGSVGSIRWYYIGIFLFFSYVLFVSAVGEEDVFSGIYCRAGSVRAGFSSFFVLRVFLNLNRRLSMVTLLGCFWLGRDSSILYSKVSVEFRFDFAFR